MLARSKLLAAVADRLSRWRPTQDSHLLDLLRGASLAGVLKGLSAIFSIGLSIVLGRVLGADAAGIYFLALSTITIASTIGRLGLDSAVIRLIASYASSNRWTEVRAVYRSAISVGFVCSSASAIVVFASSEHLANTAFTDPALEEPIRLMAIAIVPLSLGVLVSRALNGLSLIRDSILVLSVLPYAVALTGTLALANLWGVSGASLAYVAAVSIALVYGWIAWRRTLSVHESDVKLPGLSKQVAELVGSGVPLLIGALLQLVMQMSGPIMLGIWADNADVAQFSVAWRTAALITFVLIAVNTIAQPKFAALYYQGDKQALAHSAQKTTLIMTACATPIFLAFVAAPGIVMSMFGNDFVAGATTLQVLSVGQYVNVAAGSVGILLVMSGHERDFRNVQIAAACVVLALNIIFIPRYGASGAAIAVTAALIVQNVMFASLVWARLGIVVFYPFASKQNRTN